MKKYLLLPLATALLLGACRDITYGPVLSIGAAPEITKPADGVSFVLTEAAAADLFAEFEWTPAEYGFDAAVTYTLEMDVAGNDFVDALTVGATSSLRLEKTIGDINTLLLTKGLPGEVAANLEFRIAAKVSPDVAVLYSAPITLTITPYTVVIVYPQLQVPGSYQGWNPGDNTTVIFSARSDNRYEGYLNFPDPSTEFKYTLGPSWDTNWGDTGADGTLDASGDNILLAAAGVYKLNVNLNDLTHSFLKTDWGLIGSATPGGWDSDQNMTFDAAANKWTITLDLVAGDIKFRANDDWAINLGDDGGNLKMEYGGSNIPIAEDGNYTVELFLGAAIYTYKVTKN